MPQAFPLNPNPSANSPSGVQANTAVSAPRLAFAMLSDPGLIRSINEDACGAAAHGNAFVVCDGMGGAASGEIASQMARDTFLNSLAASEYSSKSPRAKLCEAVRAANQAVHRDARRSTGRHGMGTTLVSILIPRTEPAERSGALIAHVGDSRCYRLRAGRLEQLTRDHSLIEEQIRAGLLTAQEAAASPIRNIITRAVGTYPSVEVEIQAHPIQSGDLFLLASDGLTRELTDEQIASILRQLAAAPGTQRKVENACHTLVDAANAHGGADNITVLLVQIP